ncbi:putative Nudix hydrolase [Vibrio nigripulchritudo MADA3029]|uniref:NUDIX hydrolase n=1 Tax=Vibrio nigripulchritudo TaxID=28173 RepID=UPI0003B1FDC1|nr:NUDIX domain-containing protein [Vibrio nigripulchritudo]CCN46600.1 putative Nudix hydrolase [Vibrio nigripulchritudo MADA3020]CCN54623.1 putative Nudix hydrolase [Vibrio nigripulchritudo MADA3021]CCN59459.1 putative Nudix hydrolase [Vibrio nigripulchritudo MADA3029]BCL72078.1 DNA mismatch repair protein MutT [Vibrio nigripulchritudo]BDU33436.1 DNA mismatch repair protein MutT [Vibrio nigripulchritudo]
MKAHECVSFIILKGSQVLLERRSKLKETDPGLIAIPGGHMEESETQAQALFREVEEELNVIPSEYRYLCSLYNPTQELQLIHYFIINSWKGEMKAKEADEIQWYSLESAQIDIAADCIALNEARRVSQFL